jgi:hypothetical protein
MKRNMKHINPAINVMTSLGAALSVILATTAAQAQAPISARDLNLTAVRPADLAFDDAKMTQDAKRMQGGIKVQVPYRIHVKNLGVGASKPTQVSCSDVGDWADTTPGPNMGKLSRKTHTWSRPVPAIAAGGAYSDTVEVIGNESLVSRTCDIDPQQSSGDSNRANNQFSFKESTLALVPRDLAPAPVGKIPAKYPDLEFVVAATTGNSFTIRNVGTAASHGTAGQVGVNIPARVFHIAGCSGVTQAYLDQNKGRSPPVGPGTFQMDLPAVAVGETKTVQLPNGPYLSLSCTIVDVPNEQNTANNRLEWRKN